MADSKRLAILKALTTLFESVTKANGYQHDLTNSVYRGRLKFGETEPLPMVSILEYLRPEQQEDRPEGRNTSQQNWDLLIQGFSEDDFKNPTDPAHLLLADVKKALSRVRDETTSDYKLGRLVHDLEMDGGIVRPADEESSKAQFYLRVRVTFVEYAYDPYKLFK